MRTLRALIAALALASCASAIEAPIDAGVACRAWTAAPFPAACNASPSGGDPCADWAASMATRGTALARCAHDLPDSGFHDPAEVYFRCASADRCVDTTCTCGREPECAAGSACMRAPDGPSCVRCAD